MKDFVSKNFLGVCIGLVMAGSLFYFINSRPNPAPNPLPEPTDEHPVIMPDEISIDLGRLNEIEVKSVASVTWLIHPTYKDRLDIKEFDKKIIIIPIKEDQYWIGACTFNKGKVSVPVWMMVKCGKAPIPPPGPGPNPPIPPNPNPNPIVLNEFGKTVSDLTKKIGRQAEAKILANNFDEVAAAIRSGSITTREAMVQSMNQKVQVVLKDGKQWSGFFVWLDNELTNRDQRGIITTMAHRADHMEQIAAGLREGSK